MNTVKVYLVRKPSDFEEVKALCKKSAHEAEEGLIEETVNLPPTWYEVSVNAPWITTFSYPVKAVMMIQATAK